MRVTNDSFSGFTVNSRDFRYKNCCVCGKSDYKFRDGLKKDNRIDCEEPKVTYCLDCYQEEFESYGGEA